MFVFMFGTILLKKIMLDSYRFDCFFRTTVVFFVICNASLRYLPHSK